MAEENTRSDRRWQIARCASIIILTALHLKFPPDKISPQPITTLWNALGNYLQRAGGVLMWLLETHVRPILRYLVYEPLMA